MPRRARSPSPEQECVGCLAATPNVQFLPCQHTVMCSDCVRKVRGDARCVMCRQPVTLMKLVKPEEPPMARLLSQAESSSHSQRTTRPPTPDIPSPADGQKVVCTCGTRTSLCASGTHPRGRLYWRCTGVCSKTFVAWATTDNEDAGRTPSKTRVFCAFCNGRCDVAVSASAANNGKRYWRCPKGVTKNGKLCGRCFVAWAQ
jgi:hypothetical protein